MGPHLLYLHSFRVTVYLGLVAEALFGDRVGDVQ